MDLSQNEIKVLKLISETWRSIEDISRESGLSDYEVLRLAGFLKLKGLVEILEEEVTEIKLTDLGEKYLSEGLPEKRLLTILKESGEVPIHKAKELFDEDEFSIALGVLKKKGAISIEDGTIKLLSEVEIPEQELLKKIKEGKATLEEIQPLLSRKKLIDVTKRKAYKVRITDKGREVLKELKDEKVITKYTREVITNKLWKKAKFKEYEVDLPVKPARAGKRHPYLKLLDKIRMELVSMGFEEMDTYSILTSHFWCLDSLFVSQDHPVGELSLLDTFLVDLPELKDYPEDLKERVKRVHLKYFGKWSDEVASTPILTSHITMASARMLPKIKIPGKYFLIEKVFRYDTIDKSHFIEFYQLEGIVADERIAFGELLGLLKDLISNVFKIEKIKFYTGYFPFTEPSVEAYAKHPELGWIEVGGAGIFREELLEPFGIKTPVIAWGLGFDRLAMIYLGINDIRDLHTRDLRKALE